LQDEEVDRTIGETLGVLNETSASAAADIEKWKAILTPARLAAADVTKGKAAFARACATCHVLFDEGKAIGPELTGANRADLDYVLKNILDPNADIGRDYQLVSVETNDGRSTGGILQRETPASLVLVNQAETITIARDNLKRMERLPVSLMPPGLLASLPEQEAVDLIAYLRANALAPR
jgi:putative heme-binding domain-containing protein